MDCVYQAYDRHMRGVGYHRINQHSAFSYWRRVLQGHIGYTEQAVAPIIIERLLDGSSCDFFVEHTYLPIESILHSSTLFKDFDPTAMNKYYGEYVEKITLQPAIYFLLSNQHAVYSETVPTKGFPVMAIQIMKKEF